MRALNSATKRLTQPDIARTVRPMATVAWSEAGRALQALWRSEAGVPPPKRIFAADLAKPAADGAADKERTVTLDTSGTRSAVASGAPWAGLLDRLKRLGGRPEPQEEGNEPPSYEQKQQEAKRKRRPPGRRRRR